MLWCSQVLCYSMPVSHLNLITFSQKYIPAFIYTIFLTFDVFKAGTFLLGIHLKMCGCYHWRWQIEVAFRYLKHANGLLYFHSKKPEYLKQEIYANLILYNFGVFLANEAIQENQKKNRITNKYQYEVDFSSALKISRKYFIRGRSSKNRIIKLIVKYIHAVKSEFRQFSHPLRGISAIHFGYR